MFDEYIIIPKIIITLPKITLLVIFSFNINRESNIRKTYDEAPITDPYLYEMPLYANAFDTSTKANIIYATTTFQFKNSRIKLLCSLFALFFNKTCENAERNAFVSITAKQIKEKVSLLITIHHHDSRKNNYYAYYI